MASPLSSASWVLSVVGWRSRAKMSDKRKAAFERIEKVMKELRDRPYTEVTVVKTEGGHSTTETVKLWKRGYYGPR